MRALALGLAIGSLCSGCCLKQPGYYYYPTPYDAAGAQVVVFPVDEGASEYRLYAQPDDRDAAGYSEALADGDPLARFAADEAAAVAGELDEHLSGLTLLLPQDLAPERRARAEGVLRTLAAGRPNASTHVIVSALPLRAIDSPHALANAFDALALTHGDELPKGFVQGIYFSIYLHDLFGQVPNYVVSPSESGGCTVYGDLRTAEEPELRMLAEQEVLPFLRAGLAAWRARPHDYESTAELAEPWRSFARHGETPLVAIATHPDSPPEQRAFALDLWRALDAEAPRPDVFLDGTLGLPSGRAAERVLGQLMAARRVLLPRVE